MVFSLKKWALSFSCLISFLVLSSCDDGDVNKEDSSSCFVLQQQRINTEDSAVSILFTVENCNGEPVPHWMLTEKYFDITENNQELSPEAHREILRGRGQEIFINLLLDMSDSTKPNLIELRDGAKKFVNSVLVEKELDIKIAIELFDGSADLVKFQLPTSSVETLNSKLDELLTYTAIDGASTNLNGALFDSVSELQQYQLSYMQRNYNGVVTTGYVVLFTDGGDSAGRLDADTASNLVQEARYTLGSATDLPTVQTYAVALKGEDYDPEALQNLIENPLQENISYIVEASSSSQFESTFEQIAARISGQIESTFLLAYCSSKRDEMVTVNIGLKSDVAEQANTISFTFDSNDFGPGCNQDYFETACDGLQCGGFNCGACDDSDSICDSETLQCESYCLEVNKCDGEIITNPQGYEMECSFGESVTKCNGECVDTANNPNNCGECGNSCGEFEECLNGQCLTFIQISAGSAHNCVLTNTGEVYCWGFNSSGQLGDGTTTERFTPTLVTGGHSFIEINAGISHRTCGLTSTGETYCWGKNEYGQLGDGTTTDRDTPTLVTGGALLY
ncbi:MAG: hypothetical protein PF689_08865 [Deltaproteobacteria bacterium]|nr:hypothetical protein [Deltaproteobacteria bacterium]